MVLEALHKRVVGLDVHQAQITVCALIVSGSRGPFVISHELGA